MKIYNKTSNYSYFPVEEYHARCLNMAKLMDLKNMDLCIISGKENINYFAGYDFGELQMNDKYFKCFLIIPRDFRTGPILIVGEGNEGTAVGKYLRAQAKPAIKKGVRNIHRDSQIFLRFKRPDR